MELQKNSLAIYLIFLLIISYCDNIDYCTLETQLCKFNHKHIGCEQNFFPLKLNNPYKLEVMSSELKKFILDGYNTFREDVANGLYADKGLQKASNMRSLRWNLEFEYLTGKSIQNLDFGDYSACIATTNFKSPSETQYMLELFNTHITSEELFNAVIESNINNKTKWDHLLDPNHYEIGCSFGKLKNSNETVTAYIIKCYSSEETNNLQKYDIGEPCSKCNSWGEVCDDSYPGLCVPGPPETRGNTGLSSIGIDKSFNISQQFKGEKGSPGLDGLKGDQGLKGDKGSQGIKGEIGSKGERGNHGIQGDKGSEGKQGLIGEKGDKGTDGIKGTTGEAGRMGPHGLKGESGSKGDAGKNGEKGDRGHKGDYGEKGDRGMDGINGHHGKQGLIGEKGDNGIGVPGIPGITGEKGERGRDGEKGSRGEPGRVVEESYITNLAFLKSEIKKFPLSFWTLYGIVVLGIISSCLFTIIVNYEKKQSVRPRKSQLDLELN